MTDKPDSIVPGYEAGKDAAELFGRITRLLVYGNGGGLPDLIPFLNKDRQEFEQ